MDYWITKILHVLFISTVYCQQFFNTIPPPVNTNFTCRGRDTGFYADLETNCRVYHTCDDHGNKFTYYCPAETSFRQEALVCDHAHLVDCANGRRISQLEGLYENNRENPERKIEVYKRTSIVGGTISKDDFSYGQHENVGGRNLDSFQPGSSNSAYTRSFRITPEPTSQLSAPKSFNGPQQPTFSLNSSVFLRTRSNTKKNPSNLQIQRGATEGSRSSHNSEKLLIQNPDKKEETKEEYSRKLSSSMPTTTFKVSFGEDFMAKSNFPSTRDGNYPGKFLSTISTSTPTSFGENDRVKGSSDKFPSFNKFKFNHANNADNDRNSASREQLDNDGMNHRKSLAGIQFDDKQRNDKIEAIDNFRNSAISSDREDGFRFESRGRTKEGFQGITAETLRSMQASNGKSPEPNLSSPKVDSLVSSTTSAAPPTAGTEFPVHRFVGSLSALVPNELEDDPYYPRRSTTTEVYYKLSDLDRGGKKTFSFSTARPWPGSVNFEIPDVLPDLNTLDDLVDRRKLFFIPRVKVA